MRTWLLALSVPGQGLDVSFGMMKLASIALVVGISQAAVSGGAAAQTSAARSAALPPLSRLAAEHMLVLPVQYLTLADSLGASGVVPPAREYLAGLDDEIAFAFAERGLAGRWRFASDIARAVGRNAGYAPDPKALNAGPLRAGAKTDPWQLGEPLASQLRSLVALTDARYVLVPVELRVTGSRSSARAVLHVVVVDARRSQIQWAGDVVGKPTSAFSGGVAADLASRLGDLVAPRTE